MTHLTGSAKGMFAVAGALALIPTTAAAAPHPGDADAMTRIQHNWTAGAAFDCNNTYMHLHIEGKFAATVYLDWTPTDWSSPYVRTLTLHNSAALGTERADIDLSKGAWGMRTENPWGIPDEDAGIAEVYTQCELNS